MRTDTQRYLEYLCDRLVADGQGLPDTRGRGIEPFALGSELRFSPTRTKAVMCELMQHHLLDIRVVTGSDGRNELQMCWNRETERWYARMMRFRNLRRRNVAGRAEGRRRANNRGETSDRRGVRRHGPGSAHKETRHRIGPSLHGRAMLH